MCLRKGACKVQACGRFGFASKQISAALVRQISVQLCSFGKICLSKVSARWINFAIISFFCSFWCLFVPANVENENSNAKPTMLDFIFEFYYNIRQ